MYTNWKKITFCVLDIILAVYLVMAITSWNTPDKNHRVCTKVNIEISDSKNAGFLTAEEIKHILQKHNLYPLNKKMEKIVNSSYLPSILAIVSTMSSGLNNSSSIIPNLTHSMDSNSSANRSAFSLSIRESSSW